MNNKFNNKNNNNADLVRRMFDALNKKVVTNISEIQMSKFFTGVIETIDKGSVWANVRLLYGNENPLLTHIHNKSNSVLMIGDLVSLIAPNGDLSNIYIDRSNMESPMLKDLGDISELNSSDVVSAINNIINRIDNIDVNNSTLPEYPCKIIRDVDGKASEFQFGESSGGNYIWRQLLVRDIDGKVEKITQENPDGTFDIVFHRDDDNKVDLIDLS
jgi:hypothetical protein